MGRRWVFAFETKIGQENQELLNTEAAKFFSGWNSHGSLNHCEWRLLNDQFLVVYVPDQAGGPSGCSIDSLVQFVSKLSNDINNPLLNEHHIIYQQAEGDFKSVSRVDFKRLVDSGELESSMIVADLSAVDVNESPDMKSASDIFSGFLRSASESWHKKYWE